MNGIYGLLYGMISMLAREALKGVLSHHEEAQQTTVGRGARAD
jgi:hypothetical protein